MKKITFLILCLIIKAQSFSQSFDNLDFRFPDDYESTFFPYGYSYVEGNGSDILHLFADFNGDNKNDLACILTNDETSETILFIALSGNTVSLNYCDWSRYRHHNIDFKGGILEIFSDNGSIKVFGGLKLKYDRIKKKMIIISSEGVENIRFKKWVPVTG